MIGPAVSAASFCKNDVLIQELLCEFSEAKLNRTGKVLQKEELIQFLTGYRAAIVGTEQISSEVLDKLPDLRFIAKYGVGLDNLDLKAMEKRGIALGWTGGVNRRSVSEMALAFMIGLCRNLFFTSEKLRRGQWDKRGGVQLSEKTVGIVGCGFVGTDLLRLLQPFGCNLLICDILDKSDVCSEFNARQVDLDELLSNSDLVSLHLPLTEFTNQMVDAHFLQRMKESAYLINTSRGAMICESELEQALKEGVIAGAAVDVYQMEPPENLSYLGLPNLVCTPHIGGNAVEAVLAMGRSAIEHLIRWQRVSK